MSNSSKLGRNDPCRCGSGKKFKHCCINAADSTESAIQRVRQLESASVEETLSWCRERFEPDMLEAAWLDFVPIIESDAAIRDIDRALDGAFIPWFLFRWSPDGFISFGDDDSDIGNEGAENVSWPADESLPPLALFAAADRHEELDPARTAFLRAACERPYGFHQIVEIEPGKSLRLRELLTGEECVVQERSGSRNAEPGQILYARTLGLDGISLIFGCAGRALPPDYAIVLFALRDSLQQEFGKLDAGTLFALDEPLREVYCEILEKLLDPAPLVLQNTDGDPLELTKLEFELTTSPEATARALAPLSIGDPLDEILGDAERDASGAIVSVELDWMKRGKRKRAGSGNTVLGTLRIQGNRLYAEVNSEKRAARLRVEIERRLAGHARFLTRSVESLDDLRADRGDESAEERAAAEERLARSRELEQLPEVQAYLAKHRESHWREWLDMALPALGGQTPREAARTPAGRERLEALLLSFESDATQDANPLAPDVPTLRRALGM